MTITATTAPAESSSSAGVARLLGRLIPRGEDLADLLAEHGSYSAVARLLGVTANGVAYAAKRSGLTSPRLRGGRRRCALCQLTSSEATVLRFVLSRYIDRDGARTNRGAGTMYLCEQDWRSATAEARVLPRRAYSRRAA